MGKGYWFASRPPEVSHRHPFLVFDTQDQLHFELTVFGKEATARVEKKTVESYLRALLPFFTYLEVDEWPGNGWNTLPVKVQHTIEDYLIHQLHCVVRQHHQGFHLVFKTDRTHQTVKLFLSGLKLFYLVMCQQGYYPHPNPLIDPAASTIQFIETRDGEEIPVPRMPDRSGVVEPSRRRKPRLSESYFKLEDEQWIPQVVDDPTLYARVLSGGRQLKRWGLREECVTRILFESGCRVSEAVGLTLGDWVARGMTQEASASVKGVMADASNSCAFPVRQPNSCVAIPINIRPVYSQYEPFSKLQALPSDGKPVSKWTRKYEAFVDITENIVDIIRGISIQEEHAKSNVITV